MATVPRSPLYNRIGAFNPYATAISSQPLGVRDSLFPTSTLPPSGNPNFENPRGYKTAVTSLTWTQSLNLPLNVVSAPTSYDWPNPVLPKPNLELRTWTQGITVLEEPAPVTAPRCYDFPNPVLAKPNLELRTWVQEPFITSIPATPKPPTCLDFPNPTLAKPNLELRTWTQSVGTLRMPAVVKVPTGTTYDRPNPVRSEYRSIYSFVSEMNDEVIPPPVGGDTGNGSSNPHPQHFRTMRSTRGRR